MQKVKYIFLIGLFFVSLGTLAICLNHLGFALRFLGLSFWVLTVGVLSYILGLKNEK